MQRFNEEMLFNYVPSIKTLELGLTIMEKLGKLNVRLISIFKDYHRPSRIFAFIESKYSSKIEGIYTTLFDVINTGFETKQQKIIKPIVDELFASKSKLELKRIIELSDIMNTGVDQSKRYDDNFGIYSKQNGKKIKIYTPPINKDEVKQYLKRIIDKSNKDKNIIQMLHTHILFEKIHPFIDANGRLGRLILQRSIARLMNFSNVLPLSWALFVKQHDYYDAFDINSSRDIDKGVQKLLNIILHMYETVKAFTIELEKFVSTWKEIVMNTSNKMTNDIALDILLALQTKRKYVERRYQLNPRTIDSIFEKINKEGLAFNYKKANRNNLYWNIELESLVEKYFKG